MAWTPVTKPTSSIWTYINPVGKEQYDQANLSYDDSGTYYDGINTLLWTDVAKPTNGGFIQAGMATGLIMPPTYSRQMATVGWTKVSKPT